jgi:microcin C transport system ATP-binding protein
MVIKDGKVVEQGSSREIFAAPKHPYTQELLNASGLKSDTKPCRSEPARDSGIPVI